MPTLWLSFWILALISISSATYSPSSSPTGLPSSMPTSLPTAMPSVQPSAAPSSEPSAAPSSEPSANPSAAPTKSPLICEPGQMKQTPHGGCDDCPAGRYSANLTTWSDDAYGECTACGTGKYSTRTAAQNAKDCILCEAGTYASGEVNTDESDCLACQAGHYSTNSSAECSVCPPGTFSNDSSPECTYCSAGYYSPMAKSTGCFACPIATYSAGVGNSKCTACPGTQVTPAVAAEGEHECVKPSTNFVIAIICLVLLFPISFEYLGRGRFERIAFLRQNRVARRLAKDSINVLLYIRHFIYKADALTSHSAAKTKKSVNHRTLLFLFVGLILWIFGAFLGVLALLLDVYYSVLILYRNKISNVLENKLVKILQHLFADIWNQFLLVPMAIIDAFSPPLIAFFNALSKLEINLSATLGVDCPGAQAPVHLLFNLVVLGLGVVLVESDLQIFKSLAYFPLGMHSLRMQAHPVFMKWYLQRNGDTWWRRVGYFTYILGCYILQKISDIDVIQKGLLFLFSLIVFKAYDVKNTHDRDMDRTDTCDVVPGLEGIDSDILVATTVLAYFIILPGVYVLSKVLMPGLPRHIEVSMPRDIIEYLEEEKRLQLEYDLKRCSPSGSSSSAASGPPFSTPDNEEGLGASSPPDEDGNDGAEMSPIHGGDKQGEQEEAIKEELGGDVEPSGEGASTSPEESPPASPLPADGALTKSKGVRPFLEYSIEEDDNEKPESLFAWGHNLLRPFSVLSPDLWFACLTDMGIQAIKRGCPHDVMPLSSTVSGVQVHEVKSMKKIAEIRLAHRRELINLVERHREKAVRKRRKELNIAVKRISVATVDEEGEREDYSDGEYEKGEEEQGGDESEKSQEGGEQDDSKLPPHSPQTVISVQSSPFNRLSATRRTSLTTAPSRSSIQGSNLVDGSTGLPSSPEDQKSMYRRYRLHLLKEDIERENRSVIARSPFILDSHSDDATEGDRVTSPDYLDSHVYISFRKNPTHDALLSADAVAAAAAAAAADEEGAGTEMTSSSMFSHGLNDSLQHPESDILNVPCKGVSRLKLSAATTARLSHAIAIESRPYRYEVEPKTGLVRKIAQYESDEEEYECATEDRQGGLSQELDEADGGSHRQSEEKRQRFMALRRTIYGSKRDEDNALRSPTSRRQKGTYRLAKVEAPKDFSFRVSSALLGTVRNKVLGPSYVISDDACLYYCTHVVHDTKVWARLPLIVPDAGCDFIVFAIKRSIGDVVFSRCYALSLDDIDEAGDNLGGSEEEKVSAGALYGSAAMARDIMEFDDTHVVVVVSHGWSWGYGRETVPTSSDFSKPASEANNGRTEDVDLSDPDYDVRSSSDKKKASSRARTGKDKSAAPALARAQAKAASPSCNNVREALRYLGGSKDKVDRAILSCIKYYHQSHPSTHREKKRMTMLQRLASVFGMAPSTEGAASGNVTATGDYNNTSRVDAIDPYVLVGIPGKGREAALEVIKPNLGPLVGADPKASPSKFNGECTQCSNVKSVDECASKDEAGRIEVVFEVVGIETKVRQNRLGKYDTTGNSCALRVARALTCKKQSNNVASENDVESGDSRFLDPIPSSTDDAVGDGETKHSIFRHAKSRFIVSPEESCAEYFANTLEEMHAREHGMWVLDTQQTVMESGYHAESVYVNRHEIPADRVTSTKDPHAPEQKPTLEQTPGTKRSGWSSYSPANLLPSLFSRRSYLFSPFWHRNRKEDLIWAHTSQNRLPPYITLCGSEFVELQVRGKRWFHKQDWLINDHPYLKAILWELYLFGCFVVVASNFGHIITAVGRRVYGVVFWKFYKFIFFVCPGIWTEDCVEMLELNGKVDEYSMNYADLPVALAIKDVVDKRRKVKAYNYQGEHNGELFTYSESPLSRALDRSNGEWTEPSAPVTDYQRDCEALAAAENKLRKRMIGKFSVDYSNAMYSLAASRAAILQVFRYLSPITVFVSKTARYPIFIFSPHVERQIESFMPPRAPYAAARASLQASVDEALSFRDEIKPTGWCVPNPMAVSYEDGTLEAIPEWERDTIRQHNNEMKAYLKDVIAQPRSRYRVEDWQVALLGTINMFQCRLYNYLRNLFSFVLTIGITFYPEPFMTREATIVILCFFVPFATIESLWGPLNLGKMLYITDSDLLRAMPFLRCCGIGSDLVDTDFDDDADKTNGGASEAESAVYTGDVEDEPISDSDGSDLDSHIRVSDKEGENWRDSNDNAVLPASPSPGAKIAPPQPTPTKADHTIKDLSFEMTIVSEVVDLGAKLASVEGSAEEEHFAALQELCTTHDRTYKARYYLHLEALQAAAESFCDQVGVEYCNGAGSAIVRTETFHDSNHGGAKSMMHEVHWPLEGMTCKTIITARETARP